MLKTAPDHPIVSLARNATSIGDMFRRRVAQSGPHPALYAKKNGDWEALSWSDFDDDARRVAHGLCALGLEPGERVAILGPTQIPWCIQDIGAQLAGLVSFGIYPKQAPEQIRYLLQHSEAKVIFVADAKELENVLLAAEGLSSLETIIPWTVELYASHRARDPRIIDPAQMEGEKITETLLNERLAARTPEDLAILVYTSGTTGPPKGAMISHRNILEILATNTDDSGMTQGDMSLSFLPMAHVAERILAFYGRIDGGMATAYASSISAVLSEVCEVQPTVFGSVPRIFEKAYAKIHGEIEKKPPAVQ
ncbi:MAG: AMP-binding protein, partial [Nannocystaceae bacterium]